MKHLLIPILLFVASLSAVTAQDPVQRYATTGRVWGECYMLHPSVVRQQPPVNWERSLVDFLQQGFLQQEQVELTDILNTHLLSDLNDPLTRIYGKNDWQAPVSGSYRVEKMQQYDYVRLPASFLSRESGWHVFDSTLNNRLGNKPLVLDMRFYQPLKTSLVNGQGGSFDYIIGMLTPRNLPMGVKVSRFHYGWDEMNTNPHFDQEWKVTDPGTLRTLMSLPLKAGQSFSGRKNLFRRVAIKRPVHLLVNRTTLSYYKARLKSLAEQRDNVSIIYEQTGRIYKNSKLVHYDVGGEDFFMNPHLLLSDQAGVEFDYVSVTPISHERLGEVLQTQVYQGTAREFSFQMVPRQFPSSVSPLDRPYKLLGLFKLWSVARYAYPMPATATKSWDRLLKPYVRKVLNSRSDSGYYRVLRDMLGNLPHGRIILNDSKIFQFTGDFVVPFQFARIGEDLVVTRVEDSTLLPVLRPGTRIFAIGGMPVQEMLSAGSTVFLSDSLRNMNDLVFNRSNFRGRAGSEISLKVADGKGTRNLQVARTRRASGYGTWHPDTSVLQDEVAYMHPHDRWELHDMHAFSEREGLILDLRNTSLPGGYTTLYGTSVSTPVVSAAAPRTGDRRLSGYSPAKVPSFLREMPMAVLIDHTTRGWAEQLAQELSRLEGVFLVGGLTSGVPPRRAVINLPGGARILFPGQLSHPCAGEGSGKIHNKGFPLIYPDVPVEPTMESIRNGQDVVFDRALEKLRQRLQPDNPK